MNKVFILLGANLGNAMKQISQARQHIASEIGQITRQSAIYESDAWGVEDQPVFLNQVLEIETKYTSSEVLHISQKIETRLGRVRHEKWGARVIDIDILFFNNEIITSENLTIPHPYLHVRKFTLIPLNEIASDYIHPLLKKSNQELLSDCTDTLSVRKVNNNDYELYDY